MTYTIRLILLLCFIINFESNAQIKDNLSDEVNIDNLGTNEDEFQDVFFKAIAQRAVENPDQAIESLRKCLELDPQNTAVFYELAKNYIDLKVYDKAEEFLRKTLKDPDYQSNVNIHKQLFYVYNMQKRYDEAIEEAEFISKSDPVYYQELANLHLLKDEYNSALEALDRYNAIEGPNEFRDNYRMIIYKEGSLVKQGIEYFNNRIEAAQDDTRAASLLMKLYRLNNSPQKAIEIGEEFEQYSSYDPELDVEMALAYLSIGNISKAKTYSKKVVESLTLEEKDKVEVINQFKTLALQNPEAQDAFVSVLDSAFSSEKNSSNKAELGEFYKSRDKEKALKNYKSALQNNPNDFELIKNIIELELELGNYKEVVETSDKARESFPSQPILYYSKGFALGKLDNHKKATKILKEGLDYIFDNDKLKAKVYQALKESYLALGDQEKANVYEQKLIKISN